MKKEKKYLYCPTCKKYPDEIIEEYQSPIREKRRWDEDCYEIYDSNFSDVEIKSYCKECDTELIEDETKIIDTNDLPY
jgi:ribosomal protein L44E